MTDLIIRATGPALYPGPTDVFTTFQGSLRDRTYSSKTGTDPVLGDNSDASFVDLTSSGNQNSTAWVCANVVPSAPISKTNVQQFSALFRASSTASTGSWWAGLFDGSLASQPQGSGSNPTFGAASGLSHATGNLAEPDESYGVFADVAAQPGYQPIVDNWIDVLNAGNAYLYFAYSDASLGGAAQVARLFEAYVKITYPAPAVTYAPPLRQYPRSDGLGVSSARRVWPPAPSVQGSIRRVGGYS